MAPSSSRELLDLLLEDGELTSSDLDEFIARVPGEDLFLDYKDGKLTRDVKEARSVVRQWVSGFANAEGGVLVIGVTEDRPRAVSPCAKIGGEPLDAWAQKVLSDMVGFFSPPPRFKVVRRSEGDVLIIAVSRAPQLVPCTESRETKYFLRFHDSTREAPPYLISDLVLGRRKHPILVPEFGDAQFRYERGETHLSVVGNLSLSLVVENASFVFADDVEAGLVGWTFTDRPVEPLNGHLRAHVDVEIPQAPESPDWKLTCLASKKAGRSGQHLAPFDRHVWSLGGFRLPRARSSYPGFPLPKPMLFSCGLYMLAAGSSPVWFQVDVTIGDLPLDWNDRRMKLPKEYVSSARLVSSRPRVSWREKD